MYENLCDEYIVIESVKQLQLLSIRPGDPFILLVVEKSL